MKNNSIDLLVVNLLAVIPIVLILAGLNLPPLQLIFALPLVFFLPGYVLYEAMFPPNLLDGAARWALVLGSSLGLAILAGLYLGHSAWGLRPTSWALILGLFSMYGTILVWIRRQWTLSGRVSLLPRKVPPASLMLLLSSVIIVTGALVFARGSTLALSPLNTQMWIIADPEQPEERLQIGLVSTEGASTAYRLVLSHGENVVKEWPEIILPPGELWVQVLLVPPDLPAGLPLQATLYRADAPEQVYRQVIWWPGR